MVNITDMIGTNADIERRIQEQLERPKAMFSDDDRVGRVLDDANVAHRRARNSSPRLYLLRQCHIVRGKVCSANRDDARAQRRGSGIDGADLDL